MGIFRLFRLSAFLRIALLALLAAQRASAQATPSYYAINTIAGTYYSGDGGPAASALLYNPRSLAVDRAGNLYIEDAGYGEVRRVDPQGVITTVSRVPGSQMVLDADGNLLISQGWRILRIRPTGEMATIAGPSGCCPYGYSGDGGPATEARINAQGLAVDSRGNIYLADSETHRVRRIAPGGIITTVAGTGTRGFAGDGGPATRAQLNTPRGLAADAGGNLYIADYFNHRVRRVSPDGTIETIAGNGAFGSGGDGSPAPQAQLGYPFAIAVGPAGDVFLLTLGFNKVRRVSAAGIISTYAGTGSYGFSGDGGQAANAELANPNGLALDGTGNLYISDASNDRIRKVSLQGIITTIAGTGHFAGDGGPAVKALLRHPDGVAVDPAGNVYFADRDNHRIRRVNAAGVISTVAGSGAYGFSGDGGLAILARLSSPQGVALDAAGNLYVADSGNNRVRKVTPDGRISTVAGSASGGFAGDGGAAVLARLNYPMSVAADPGGNLYIADTYNYRIRRVSAGDGAITTVAGNGTRGFAGDGGPAAGAQFASPNDVAVDRAGNLYIADTFNLRVRKVNPAGIITTIAGDGTCCDAGGPGPALSARLGNIWHVTAGSDGAVYLSEGSRIRRVAPDGTIGSIACTGVNSFSGDGGLAAQATARWPHGLAQDAAGAIYFADQANHRIRKLTPLVPETLAMAGGDGQSGDVGTPLPTRLSVKVSGAGGLGVPGVTVTFAVASGSATLSTGTVATGVDGTASVQVTLGDATGEVVVTAAVTGLPPVRFTLTAVPKGATPPVPPRIASGGVFGAGMSSPKVTTISPGGLVLITGERLSEDPRLLTTSPVEGALPVEHAGTCVRMGGVQAPLVYVSPTIVSAQVPALEPGAPAPVQVFLRCGQENETGSNVEMAPVEPTSPEFFFQGSGTGLVAAFNMETGALVNATAPLKPGEKAGLLMTGLGLTDPPVPAGQAASQPVPVLAPVTVKIGDRDVPPEDMPFAGLPGSMGAGLYQVVVRIPESAPNGNLPVVVRAGAGETPPGATLPVRR